MKIGRKDMNMNEKRRMKKEESKKTVKLMGIMGIINIISCLILKWCPIYGLNALIGTSELLCVVSFLR